MDALAAAGVQVGLNPTEAGELMVEIVAGLAGSTAPGSTGVLAGRGRRRGRGRRGWRRPSAAPS